MNDTTKQNVAAPALGVAPGSDLIDVAVMVYPDGTTYWMDNPTSEAIRAEAELWGVYHPGFRGTAATSGCVLIKMPKDRYMKISANLPRFPNLYE